jgi:hypothetical protein
LVSSGQLVYIQPGTYNETITIPTGVSVRGSDAKTVILQKSGVTGDTTLIQMNANTRLDNLNATLSMSSGNYNLIGIDILSGASINAKIRNFTLNVNSTSAGPTGSIIGLRSSGTSSLNFTSADLISRTTINTNSSGSTGTYNRGILVNGPNRLQMRDTVVYSDGSGGTGSNVIGIETADVSSIINVKTSSINGVLNDIKRTSGTLQLSFTDLINANSGALGFTVNTEPAHNFFALTGNVTSPGKGTITSPATYYLIPGTASSEFAPNVPTGIPFVQKVILFEGLLSFSPTPVPVGNTITVRMYASSTPNTLGTQFASLQLTGGSSTPVKFQNISQTFTSLNQFLQIECSITGPNITASGSTPGSYNPPLIFCGIALY